MAQITRSPQYPATGLRDAIKRVQGVYEKEGRHAAPKEAIIEDIGYTGVSGSSDKMVSALLKYGLIEPHNEGFRVSDAAFTIIIHEPKHSERAEAIKEAAFRPALFQKLYRDYGMGLPSDTNLRTRLLKEGFNHNVVDRVIRIYRDTVNFVEEESAGKAIAEPVALEAEPYKEAFKPKGEHTDAEVGVRSHESSKSRSADELIDYKEGERVKGYTVLEEGWHSPLHFKIARDCEVRLAFKGEVTQKAMTKLIKLLEISTDIYPGDGE